MADISVECERMARWRVAVWEREVRRENSEGERSGKLGLRAGEGEGEEVRFARDGDLDDERRVGEKRGEGWPERARRSSWSIVDFGGGGGLVDIAIIGCGFVCGSCEWKAF